MTSWILWRPSEGDTIHVYESSPGNWDVREDFSWLGRLVGLGFGLLTLLFVYWHFEEMFIRRFLPDRWVAQKEREWAELEARSLRPGRDRIEARKRRAAKKAARRAGRNAQ